MATSSTKPKIETQYDAVIETYLSRYEDRPIVGYALACDEIMTGITKHIIHDALTYDSSNSKTYVAELRTLESCIKQMKRSLVPAEFAKVEKHYERNKSKRNSEMSLANRVLHPQYAVSDVDLGVDDSDIFVPMDTTECDSKVDAFCSSMSYVDGKGCSAVVMPYGAVLDESDVTDIDDGHIEGTAAQVIYHDLLLFLVLKAVSQGCCSGLVDDTLYIQACDLTCVLGGLTLCVVEVCRNGDDCL